VTQSRIQRRRQARRFMLVPLVLTALVATSGAASAGRVATPPLAPAALTADFPAGWEGFHTYAEMSADIAAVAAAHPDIVSEFSIGKSYQGRDLWAVKISDNVGVDEDEPEVLFDGLHHAREHMALEMTLAIMHWLVNGYGTDATITRLVNTREIWIVFNVNPDGGEYDIAGGKYHYWRKNRQPTPGSTSIGTDLNRNYDNHWGCCGGASANPASNLFRGAKAFSAPETRALSGFINSRVIGGRQQIRTAITFHTSGRLILWAYGYARTDIPPDMTVADHAVLVAMARHMGSLNGYKPEQASDLYIDSGTERDWEYGRHRIFAYTFELTAGGQYPDDSQIGPETLRNKSSILYLIDKAACPYAAIGQAQAFCGPLWDDFEIARGWRANPNGTDTATSGRWERGNPQPTSSNGARQLGTTTSGSANLVTGKLAGSLVNSNDVDGGTTSVGSPDFSLPAGGTYAVKFRYYFSHGSTSDSRDALRVRIVRDDGTEATLFQELGRPRDDVAAWATATVAIPASFVGATSHLVISASDGGPANLIEAGVDDVSVMRVGP
jgi:carboxypeptidase T